MTKRDLFEAVVNGNVTDEVVDFAKECIEKLDATNSKRRAKDAEKRAEKNEVRNANREVIVGVMTNEPMTASQLIEASGLEIKPQAIPSLMKPLLEEGTVAKEQIKVGKSKVVGYKLA